MVAKGGGGRGGGSRGGGGGSSRKYNSTAKYNSTTTRYQNNSTKSQLKLTYPLPGNNFHEPLITATLAIQCFCVLAIIGIFIWSFRVKKQGDPTRAVFNFFGLGLALISTLLSIGFQIADGFMHEFEVVVTNWYILMYLVIAWCSFMATFFLLKVTYTLVTNRFQHSRAKGGKSGPGIQWLHRCILLILGVIWLVSMYFYIRYQIFTVTNSKQLASYAKTYGETTAGFKMLVLFAVIGCTVLGLMIWLRGRKNARASKIPAYLLFMLLLALLLRSIVDAGITLAFQIRSSPVSIPNGVHLLSALLVDLPSVIVLAAIVLIGLQPDWNVAYSGVAPSAFEPMKHASVVTVQPVQTEYTGAYAGTPPLQQGMHGQPVYVQQQQYGPPQTQPLYPQQYGH